MNWQDDGRLWDAVLEKFWDTWPYVDSTNLAPNIIMTSEDPIAQNSEHLVLFQIPTHIGLGHMSRMVSVATALREVAPELQVLFVVEGATHGFLEDFNFPYVALPLSESSKRSPNKRHFPEDRGVSLCLSTCFAIIRSTKPSLIVYDCFPNRYFVQAASTLGIPNALCIRNIDDPRMYLQKPEVKHALKSCLSIIIPHTHEDSTFPTKLDYTTVYVGDIVRELPVDPLPVQLRFNCLDSKVIVVTTGGGGHKTDVAFLNICIQAITAVRINLPNLKVIIVPGPLFNAWEDLISITEVTILPFDPNLIEHCATADLVLAQAGYNSMNELAYLGTPTIAMPVARRFDNQFIRAETMAAQWQNIHIASSESFEAFCIQIESLLRQSTPREREHIPDGAFRAAFHISNLVTDLQS